jgi:hypothetical protein
LDEKYQYSLCSYNDCKWRRRFKFCFFIVFIQTAKCSNKRRLL